MFASGDRLIDRENPTCNIKKSPTVGGCMQYWNGFHLVVSGLHREASHKLFNSNYPGGNFGENQQLDASPTYVPCGHREAGRKRLREKKKQKLRTLIDLNGEGP